MLLFDHSETQREIQNQILEEIRESNLENLHLSFFLTSIYDHSIFEAYSKVVQKLVPQLPTLECLHDTLNSVSFFFFDFVFICAL
jgi:Ras-related GTP-binding protein C/D